ncbi:major facilitator superfamily domain-containing protein [Lanmaoa asiatica]|nr:major facilitator superfamily domain-containing protein [Lanmaoa asiatica]
MCLVNTYQGLLAVRVFLGLTEAGLFPGVNYYLSMWYPRENRALRIAIFFSAATVAGAFGGILALFPSGRIGGLHGWQWIVSNLEQIMWHNILTRGVSSAWKDWYPETASFLNETERRNIVGLLKNDSQYLATHYNLEFVLQALKDYKTYVQSGILIGLVVPAYAIALFTPTIINELGFSAAHAQLLSVPPFVAGCACTIIVGIYSDIRKLRGPYVIAGTFVAFIGYIVLDTQTSPGASYVGAVLAAVGVFPPIAVVLAWAGSNAGGEMKRGVVIAVSVGLANLGGVCSSFIYLDPPRFHVGHETIMGWLSLSFLLSTFAMWNYNRLNKQKKKLCRENGITEDRQGEFQNMGDDSPLFRYSV